MGCCAEPGVAAWDAFRASSIAWMCCCWAGVAAAATTAYDAFSAPISASNSARCIMGCCVDAAAMGVEEASAGAALGVDGTAWDAFSTPISSSNSARCIMGCCVEPGVTAWDEFRASSIAWTCCDALAGVAACVDGFCTGVDGTATDMSSAPISASKSARCIMGCCAEAGVAGTIMDASITSISWSSSPPASVL